MDTKPEYTKTCEDKDLARSRNSFLMMWGPPIVLIILASVGAGQGWWSSFTETILWSIGVLWIGISCYINGKRCNRLHCKIVGIAFPILGIVGILVAFKIVPITASTLNIALWILLFISFVPEFLGKKYL